MAVVLTPETQKLIEERAALLGITSADDLVRMAVQMFGTEQEEIEDIDDETLAAIEEGIAQLDRGESIPIEEVRKSFEARFEKE
jgi:hypothetical protein